MKNRILAGALVALCMYLPCLLLLFTSAFRHPEYLPVMPGWFMGKLAPNNSWLHYDLLAAGGLGVFLLLSWFGSKGRGHLIAAATLALLNSLFIVAVTYIVAGTLAATGSG